MGAGFFRINWLYQNTCPPPSIRQIWNRSRGRKSYRWYCHSAAYNEAWVPSWPLLALPREQPHRHRQEQVRWGQQMAENMVHINTHSSWACLWPRNKQERDLAPEHSAKPWSILHWNLYWHPRGRQALAARVKYFILNALWHCFCGFEKGTLSSLKMCLENPWCMICLQMDAAVLWMSNCAYG